MKLLNTFFIKTGNFFFKFRNSLFPIIFSISFILIKPSHFLSTNKAIDQYAMIAGIVIALGGAAIRLTVIGLAYIVRGGRNRKVYADDLVTTGIYAHCRNPMYVGNLLIGLGISILYGSDFIVFVIFPLFAFIYYCIVRAEENFLYFKFGEPYREYCKNVPRFIINFYDIGSTFRSFNYDWRKVLRSEYGTLTATLAGIVLIVAWKLHNVYGYEMFSIEINQLALLLLPIAVFYFTIRTLKHNGKLREYHG